MTPQNSTLKRIRKVTIVDVAREAGVSSATVSRVLSGFDLVKESTRERVMEAIERLGYVVNLQARHLASGRSHIIGLVVPNVDNNYVGTIMRGIDEELQRANYDLMLYSTHRQQGKEATYVNTIANGLAEGLLLVAPQVPDAYLDALCERNIPYVLIDQTDTTGQSAIVDATNWQGAYEATRYLCELGHTRIAFIGGIRTMNSALERLSGYKAALADYDIPVCTENVVDGGYWQPGGYEATKMLMQKVKVLPTAIFAANDLSAFGAMEAIREFGLDIPDDVSVVGFDDIPQASLAYPKLTTVRQPLEQMGRIAVKMLLEQIDNPGLPRRHVTLATKLIIRNSCAPCPSEKR